MSNTQILPVGEGEASSSDFVMGQMEWATIAMNDDQGPAVSQGAMVRIEIKDPAGNYFELFTLRSRPGGQPGEIGTQLSSPGTFRVTRLGPVRCGAFISK